MYFLGAHFNTRDQLLFLSVSIVVALKQRGTRSYYTVLYENLDNVRLTHLSYTFYLNYTLYIKRFICKVGGQ